MAIGEVLGTELAGYFQPPLRGSVLGEVLGSELAGYFQSPLRGSVTGRNSLEQFGISKLKRGLSTRACALAQDDRWEAVAARSFAAPSACPERAQRAEGISAAGSDAPLNASTFVSFVVNQFRPNFAAYNRSFRYSP